MFFYHEDLKTWEEICEIAFRGMPPQHQAQLEAKAHAAGCSVQEVFDAVMNDYLDEGGGVLPYFEWAQQPYGKDPLLTQREP